MSLSDATCLTVSTPRGQPYVSCHYIFAIIMTKLLTIHVVLRLNKFNFVVHRRNIDMYAHQTGLVVIDKPMV